MSSTIIIYGSVKNEKASNFVKKMDGVCNLEGKVDTYYLTSTYDRGYKEVKVIVTFDEYISVSKFDQMLDLYLAEMDFIDPLMTIHRAELSGKLERKIGVNANRNYKVGYKPMLTSMY